MPICCTHCAHDSGGGKANQEYPDEAILIAASVEQRIVLTINRKDFIRLHRMNALHQGIIVCTADLDFSGQARRIHELLTINDSMVGKLIRVNRSSVDSS